MKPSELDKVADAIDRLASVNLPASPRFAFALSRIRTAIDGTVEAFRTQKRKIVNECALRNDGEIVMAGPLSVSIDPEKGDAFRAAMAELDAPIGGISLDPIPLGLWPESMPLDIVFALSTLVGPDPPPAPAAS